MMNNYLLSVLTLLPLNFFDKVVNSIGGPQFDVRRLL